MIYDGFNGGTVELLEDVLVIRRKGVLSALNQGLKGEKRIPYASITSVQFKSVGITTGYIQFGVIGGLEGRGGVLNATSDENTVLFVKKAEDQFSELRDKVERRSLAARQGASGSRATPTASVGEELTRLADLRDRGVLTEEEFAAQKAAILGIAPAQAASPPISDRVREPSRAVSPPPQKKGGAGRVLGFGCLGIIGIFVLLAVIGSQVPEPKAADTARPAGNGATTEAAVAPLQVTAAQLFRAYQANEARAQQDYGNRPLLVSGTVAGVDLDISDNPVVQLVTDNEFMPAHANLVDASKPDAANLSKGERVKLLCEGIGEVIGTPMLKECAFQ